jgi:hypothetical protein
MEGFFHGLLASHHVRRFSPMRSDTRAWLDGLRGFATEERSPRPPPDDAPPTAAFAAERMIIAARLTALLVGIDLLTAARRTRGSGGTAGYDPDAALVLSTGPAGLATAADLVGPTGPFSGLGSRLVAVTERQYRLWCIRTPDPAFERHVNLWNWVKTRVPPERNAEFARHPLAAGESYWLHRVGVAGAGAADRHECHLWKWNGRHASLLEALVTEGVVGRGAGGRG